MTASLKDAIYGAAVGDALGVPYEFLDGGTFTCGGMATGGVHSQPAGTWSDDTSMMLATCDSIRAKHGKIDTRDMLERFRDWAYKGNYTPHGFCFDIGNTTSRALDTGKGGKDEWDNGNGSLMRILPLAFTNATDDEIAAVSAITHAHSVSCEACIMYVHIARALREGMPAAQAVASCVGTQPPFERLAHIAEVPEDEIKSGGYVVETLEASLWCLLNTENYADCVVRAVNFGHDSDTTACVAGGLAGIVYGYDAIPSEWIDILCSKDIIDACLFEVC